MLEVQDDPAPRTLSRSIMASPPTWVRYIGSEHPEFYGLGGVAYIPTALGDRDCEVDLQRRGQTTEKPFLFASNEHDKPHFNEEIFVGRDDLVFGKYIFETSKPEYPDA